nr:hypothetical protein [Methanobrevibacter arboriphilus]
MSNDKVNKQKIENCDEINIPIPLKIKILIIISLGLPITLFITNIINYINFNEELAINWANSIALLSAGAAITSMLYSNHNNEIRNKKTVCEAGNRLIKQLNNQEENLEKQLEEQSKQLDKQLSWHDEKKSVINLSNKLIQVVSNSYERKEFDDFDKKMPFLGNDILDIGEKYNKSNFSIETMSFGVIEHFLDMHMDEEEIKNKFNEIELNKVYDDKYSDLVLEYELNKKLYRNFRNCIFEEVMTDVELFSNLPKKIQILLEEYGFTHRWSSIIGLSEDQTKNIKAKYYLKITPLIIKIYKELTIELKLDS